MTDEPDHEVAAVRSRVIAEAGRWAVYLDVVLDDGAVSHRVGDYPSKAQAEQAADIVVRNAGRRVERPTGF